MGDGLTVRERFVRIQRPLLNAIEEFISEQDGVNTRPEAIRLILGNALIGDGPGVKLKKGKRQ